MSGWLKTLLAAGAVGAALGAAPGAEAANGFCSSGLACGSGASAAAEQDARYTIALQRAARVDSPLRRRDMSDQDYSAFSGVGVIACSLGGETRAATAFLVGAFDIAVTVGRTFSPGADGLEPECLYNSLDSRGQVRERIPVAYAKTQWSAEPAAGHDPQKDLAVVRLSQPSRYAQRTMPLGRFSGAPTPAVLVGYKANLDVDTIKRKARGTVSGRTSPAGYVHDFDSRDLAAGSPVLDERTGVIIGVHSPAAGRKDAMIAMNEWLEATLRDEMKLAGQAGAKVAD